MTTGGFDLRGLVTEMKRFLSSFALVAFLLGAPIASDASPNACKWNSVSSPNKSGASVNNTLLGTVAISDTDAWAAGAFTDTNGDHALLEHWNGSVWSIVAAPAPPGTNDRLFGMSATSSHDVWAVGNYFNTADNHFEPLIEHFDGANWSITPAPNGGAKFNLLRAVSARTAGNAWAVGQYFDPLSGRTLTLAEHWNGRTWSLEPGLNQVQPWNSFVAVAAFGTKNVYAIDDSAPQQNGGGNLVPAVQHYDGQWNFEPTPVMGSSSSPLNALAPITQTDIWALGDWFDGTTFQTLAENWNGSTWTIVPSADQGAGVETVIFGAAGAAPADVWGVGAFFDGSKFQTYTMFWNGTKWKTMNSPNAGTGNNQLNSAASIVNSVNVWAVGSRDTSFTNQFQKTLTMEFHC